MTVYKNILDKLDKIPLKEELHHKLKFSMFCVLSENYQHFFDKWHKQCILKQNVWETQNGITVLVRPNVSWVTDYNTYNIIFINNSKTAWPTEILIHFFSFSTILLMMLILFFKTV